MNLHGNEKEFFRLMDFPLPVQELYPHYMEMLAPHEALFDRYVKEFNEYAKWATDMGYRSCQNYRLDHAMKAFETWANSTELLKDIKYDVNEFKPKDARRAFMNDMPVEQGLGPFNSIVLPKDAKFPLMSFDIVEANYSVLKLGAKQKGMELPHRWSEFCDKVLRLHPFLAQRKAFRQQCLGNYSPQTYSGVQKSFIQSIVDKFDLYDNAVFISHDEIVMPYDKEGSDQLHRDIYDHIRGSAYDGAIGIKTTLYEMYRLDDDGALKIIYDGGWNEQVRRKLFSVPKNKYYMYYRKYIMQQPLQDGDIIFMNDGLKAKWMV